MTYKEAVGFVNNVFDYFRVQHLDYDRDYDDARAVAIEALENMEGMLAKSGRTFQLNVDTQAADELIEKLQTPTRHIGLWQTAPIEITSQPFAPIATSDDAFTIKTSPWHRIEEVTNAEN